MEKALQFSEFSRWLEGDQGQHYLRCEQEELNDFLPQLYGYYLVQAGIIDSYDLKSGSTINHHIYVGRVTKASPNQLLIEATLDELPFQFESVDVFFLPHTLEFCPSPKKLLNEIYNILIPGGKVIILGFNPYSFYGLTKLLKSDKNNNFHSKLIRLGEIKNRLLSTGFSIDFNKYFCFTPPRQKASSENKPTLLECVGKHCFPAMGALYVLVAQKTVVPFSPMKLKVFTKKIRVARGFPEPSTNKGGL